MGNILCQIALTLLGAGTIGLLALGGRWTRWGFVVGLVSEVFWFRLAWVHGQVDIFLLSIWYTVCFGYGVWRSFRREKK